MSSRFGTKTTIVATALVALVLAAGGVVVGRASIDTNAAHESGYRSGLYDGYFNGLPAGEAQGRREGRTLQEGIALPADDRQAVKHAFADGYAAGANDALAGYDGGWELSMPYVIVVGRSSGGITYRIASRVPVKKGVSYYLCPDGRTLCHRPLR